MSNAPIIPEFEQDVPLGLPNMNPNDGGAANIHPAPQPQHVQLDFQPLPPPIVDLLPQPNFLVDLPPPQEQPVPAFPAELEPIPPPIFPADIEPLRPPILPADLEAFVQGIPPPILPLVEPFPIPAPPPDVVRIEGPGRSVPDNGPANQLFPPLPPSLLYSEDDFDIEDLAEEANAVSASAEVAVVHLGGEQDSLFMGMGSDTGPDNLETELRECTPTAERQAPSAPPYPGDPKDLIDALAEEVTAERATAAASVVRLAGEQNSLSMGMGYDSDADTLEIDESQAPSAPPYPEDPEDLE